MDSCQNLYRDFSYFENFARELCKIRKIPFERVTYYFHKFDAKHDYFGLRESGIKSGLTIRYN